MKLFKKEWTPAEADEWTSHDFWASLLGVLSYILVAVGIIGAFLLQTWGFVAVFLALVLGALYYRTHRIVPAIVLHMAFNATNLFILWLEVRSEAPARVAVGLW